MPKNKHNAFFCFMVEYKRREESKGRRFRGLEEVSRIAGPIWKEMDARKRLPYVEKAQQKSDRPKDRLNSQGVPLTVLTAKERSEESRASSIRNRIESMISKAAESNMLERLEFYFVSCGYFCALSDGRYVPAEVAAVRYSLESGVMDSIHMLINPGALPVGKSLDAKQHTDSFHQLPLPPDALGEDDFETIERRLLEFFKSSGRTIPLLFTDRSDIRHVESIMKDILNAHESGLDVVVCALADMFFLLKKSVLYYSLSLPEGFPAESIPQMLLDRDVYNYTPDISCDFHEQQGNGTYCCLSRCIRWAYVISDSCCLDLHIDMLPGKHIPKNCVSQLDVLSTNHESSSEAFSKNDAMRLNSGSVSKGSNQCQTGTSAMSASTSSKRSGFSGDYIELESSRHRNTVDSSNIMSDDSTDLSMPMSGPGSMYSRGMIHPVLGVGRGRRIQYDNTPPGVSNRKSFK